jgi:hypothetical protein
MKNFSCDQKFRFRHKGRFDGLIQVLAGEPHKYLKAAVTAPAASEVLAAAVPTMLSALAVETSFEPASWPVPPPGCGWERAIRAVWT